MKYDNLDQAYREVLHEVWTYPDYNTAPRGLPIREKVDYQFTVLNPTSDAIKTVDEERNKVIADYTAKEVALYDSGSNKVVDFAKASKFWEKLANPDGTINSAYGFLIWKNYSCTSQFSNEAMTPWSGQGRVCLLIRILVRRLCVLASQSISGEGIRIRRVQCMATGSSVTTSLTSLLQCVARTWLREPYMIGRGSVALWTRCWESCGRSIRS